MSRQQSRTVPAALTAESVIDYLVGHGVLPHAMGAVPLGGGVSADAFAVHSETGSWVVKQALPQLKVAVEWHADPTRILNEAAALRVAQGLLPESIPPVTLVDPERFILVMQHAPPHLGDWKAELMAGGNSGSIATAARLGTILATLHARTLDESTLRGEFGDVEPFVELRVDPFHRTVAAKMPELADQLDELAEQLTQQPVCLVHGDYSPKNVLASASEVWVIDWEVAHFGNPVFDLAFMLTHLLCKTVHLPSHYDLYLRCARAFLGHYRDGVPERLRPDPVDLVRHTAAIVLSRTDGKSPAAYLDSDERDRARRHAIALMASNTANDDIIQQLWSGLT